MILWARATHRLARGLAGVALLLAVSGCTAASPAPAWTATGNMDGVRAGYTATLLLDGRVLVAGGGGSSGVDALASAELYDPDTGSWTATGNMHEGRNRHTSTLLLDGRVLVAGGGNSEGVDAVASAELYDPDTGSWTATGNMHGGVVHPQLGVIDGRNGHTATLLLDGRVLVAGGSSFNVGSSLHALASAELYDPDTGSWTATGNMDGVRYRHTATLLPDGKVLVVGGTTDAGPLASAELYDPNGASWTATGNMAGGRFGHTATLLADGKVLVAGGGGSVASAELYDPSSASWTATVDMITPRLNQTATLLADGKVLVAGGEGLSGPLASAELYDPSSGS